MLIFWSIILAYIGLNVGNMLWENKKDIYVTHKTFNEKSRLIGTSRVSINFNERVLCIRLGVPLDHVDAKKMVSILKLHCPQVYDWDNLLNDLSSQHIDDGYTKLCRIGSTEEAKLAYNPAYDYSLTGMEYQIDIGLPITLKPFLFPNINSHEKINIKLLKKSIENFNTFTESLDLPSPERTYAKLLKYSKHRYSYCMEYTLLKLYDDMVFVENHHNGEIGSIKDKNIRQMYTVHVPNIILDLEMLEKCNDKTKYHMEETIRTSLAILIGRIEAYILVKEKESLTHSEDTLRLIEEME